VFVLNGIGFSHPRGRRETREPLRGEIVQLSICEHGHHELPSMWCPTTRFSGIPAPPTLDATKTSPNNATTRNEDDPCHPSTPDRTKKDAEVPWPGVGDLHPLFAERVNALLVLGEHEAAVGAAMRAVDDRARNMAGVGSSMTRDEVLARLFGSKGLVGDRVMKAAEARAWRNLYDAIRSSPGSEGADLQARCGLLH
jgi:hypothetical protein